LFEDNKSMEAYRLQLRPQKKGRRESV